MRCEYCREEEGKHIGHSPKPQSENKSWNEFLEWADEEWPYANVLHKFVYDRLLDYEKIGLLIEFLKSKDTDKVLDVYRKPDKGFEVHIKDLFTVENLELWVRELKPKEDDEIEKIEQELSYMWSNGYSWKDIAKKAMEIIKGK